MIQQFRIDAQRFFAGDLHVPPNELRDRIQGEVRALRRSNLHGAAQNFRLNSLEAQLNSHLDLFNRRLREREMGIPGKPAVRSEPRRPDPEKEGVVLGSRGDSTAVETLYQGIYLRSKTRNPKMDLERFRTYLDRQVAAIRAKTGCSEVLFRVSVENGKTKLKARPVRRGA